MWPAMSAVGAMTHFVALSSVASASGRANIAGALERVHHELHHCKGEADVSAGGRTADVRFSPYSQSTLRVFPRRTLFHHLRFSSAVGLRRPTAGCPAAGGGITTLRPLSLSVAGDSGRVCGPIR